MLPRQHQQKDENPLLLKYSSAAGGEVEFAWCFEPES